MFDSGIRWAKQRPDIALTLCGVGLIAGAMIVSVNMKGLDEHVLSVNSSFHRYHGRFLVVGRLVMIAASGAVVLGCVMLGLAVLIWHRRRHQRILQRHGPNLNPTSNGSDSVGAQDSQAPAPGPDQNATG